jgi:hypothetical protein
VRRALSERRESGLAGRRDLDLEAGFAQATHERAAEHQIVFYD